MQVSEFRQKIKPGISLLIEGKQLKVLQVVKFRLDNGDFYIKCFLDNDYVIADDLEGNSYILVKELETPFNQPFPKSLKFDGKEFQFIYEAHSIAEEVFGEGFFYKGFREKFWDYQADDGSYLSLGIHDKTRKRQDLYGKIIAPDKLDIKL